MSSVHPVTLTASYPFFSVCCCIVFCNLIQFSELDYSYQRASSRACSPIFREAQTVYYSYLSLIRCLVLAQDVGRHGRALHKWARGNRPLTKSGVRFLCALYRVVGLLSRSEQFDSGDRGRLTRSPVTIAVVPASHLDEFSWPSPRSRLLALLVDSGSQCAQMCPDAPNGRRVSGSELLYINNRYRISTGVITVLGEFSSWDRAHAQRTCRRVVGRP
uniref:Uncharacterized protein n=1 Tax=Hyaloperonospora arabidopsidis (strain Emoy2) TaxID=559515 RepID=M4BNM9_HYAAE